jgi:hypothetical protein
VCCEQRVWRWAGDGGGGKRGGNAGESAHVLRPGLKLFSFPYPRAEMSKLLLGLFALLAFFSAAVEAKGPKVKSKVFFDVAVDGKVR